MRNPPVGNNIQHPFTPLPPPKSTIGIPLKNGTINPAKHTLPLPIRRNLDQYITRMTRRIRNPSILPIIIILPTFLIIITIIRSWGERKIVHSTGCRQSFIPSHRFSRSHINLDPCE
ncbi:hypothetical protein AA313_de0207287 [Arthrobotrys entomopaga]|nr:hypothetical protein AA313_de0207287 [Arthrobotrys entomopaga]